MIECIFYHCFQLVTKFHIYQGSTTTIMECPKFNDRRAEQFYANQSQRSAVIKCPHLNSFDLTLCVFVIVMCFYIFCSRNNPMNIHSSFGQLSYKRHYEITCRNTLLLQCFYFYIQYYRTYHIQMILGCDGCLKRERNSP